MSSIAAVDTRPRLGALVASSMVAAVFIVLLVVGWVLSGLLERRIIPPLGGLSIFLPWLLYAGLAALVAVRSSSEAAVTATAMLLPSTYVAVNYLAVDGGRLWLPLVVVISLAPAFGVFLGMWAGSAVMRPGGPARTFAGLVAAGALSAVGAALLAIPAFWIVVLL